MVLLRPLQALLRLLHVQKAPVGSIALDPAFSDGLREIAQEARKFLEPRWHRFHLASGNDFSTPSAKMCVISNKFLEEILTQNEIEANFCYGKSIEKKGFRYHGKWRSHGWVEIGNAIIDITSDQFRNQKIIITTIDDPRYRKGDGRYSLDDTGKSILQGWLSDWEKSQLTIILPKITASQETGQLLSHHA